VSFPGTDEVKTDSKGNLICGNEVNLIEYLKKVNRLVPYIHFEHGMFENANIDEVSVTDRLTPVDVIVAVPVCSGLSNVTIAKEETKDERNCNMLWITKYALKILQPKVYIFENAHTLIAERGKAVRTQLEMIAEACGYSVAYYKTDTKLHHNCQKRPRTFVCFFKKTRKGTQRPPQLGWEYAPITAKEYFDLIPEDATQQIPFEMSTTNKLLLSFIEDRVSDWRHNIHAALYRYVTDNWLFDEFCDYIRNSDAKQSEKDSIIKWVQHSKEKTEQGLNFYSTAMCTYGDNTPSVMFKTIQTMMHHKEDRLITVREALHLMGLPSDFELIGDPMLNGPKIGQNVPVNTAKWIVEQCIENMDSKDRRTDSNVTVFDNTKQEEKDLDD
jgi:site-specific DNA-cytosine methylase